MKTKFIYIAIAVALVVLLFNNREAVAAQVAKFTGTTGPDSTGTTGSTGSNTGGSNNMPGGLDYDVILQSGSRGAEVRKLQEILNGLGYTPPLVVDGIFGIKTTNALKFYNSGATSITLREAYQKLLTKAGSGLF